MALSPRLVLGATLVLSACTPADRETVAPLPNRQTAIDPVTKKLEAAASDAGRRRLDSDPVK